MELEANHINADTIKYAKPLEEDSVYQDAVIMLGFIMNQRQDKMSIENMFSLKMAQAVICELGLEHELENIKGKLKGE